MPDVPSNTYCRQRLNVWSQAQEASPARLLDFLFRQPISIISRTAIEGSAHLWPPTLVQISLYHLAGST